jgi:hypothetical protein
MPRVYHPNMSVQRVTQFVRIIPGIDRDISVDNGLPPVVCRHSRNVHDHVPDHSIISWHDFLSTQELGEYLQQVATDKALYEPYHAWRTKPLPEKFHSKYDMTQVHSVCRTCKYLHAKQHGWGWNHERQDMQELRLPRKVCVDEQGRII